MSTQLPDDILDAIKKQGNGPLLVVNPHTRENYWILNQSQMERFRAMFEATALSQDEQKSLIRQAGERAGWDDPEMDVYDNYDQHRAKQS